MSNINNNLFPPPPTITVMSPESLGPLALAIGTAGYPSASTWPSANRAYYIPFRLNRTITVKRLFALNGTASGNFDIGIYDEFGTRIVSTGSTAQTGNNLCQSVDITDTQVGPGRFYFAAAGSTTSVSMAGLLSTALTANIDEPLMNCYVQASALPLPASATFATSPSNYMPIVGLSTVAIV